jgi:hypothetical protein
METPWKVIVAFIGVFVAGAIFGGVFTLGAGKRFHAMEPAAPQVVQQQQTPPRQVAQQPTPTDVQKTDRTKQVATKPPPLTLGMMRELTKRLSPTSEQQKAFRPIVQRASEDIQRSQREHIAETSRVMDRMYEDISALLSPEQRILLEKIRQELLEKSRQERMKRGANPADLEGANRGGGPARPTSVPPKTNTP